MANLMELASTDRNPIQETEYRNLLKAQGIPFTVVNGRANVEGFGTGGNAYGEAAQAFFSPSAIAGRNLETTQSGKISDFINRFTTGTQSAQQAISEQLGLPQTLEDVSTASEAATQAQKAFSGIAPTQETLAKQVGISAPRLQRRIASEQAEYTPALEAANVGLSQAITNRQAALEQYGIDLQTAMAPYEVEAGLLGTQVQAAYDTYKTNLQNEISLQIAKLQSETALTQSEIDKSIELAKLAEAAESGSITVSSAGDRLVVLDSQGNVINEIPMGVKPTQVSGISGW